MKQVRDICDAILAGGTNTVAIYNKARGRAATVEESAATLRAIREIQKSDEKLIRELREVRS